MNLRLSTLLIFTIVQIGCSKEKDPQQCLLPVYSDAYNFPIKPGDPKWYSLQSNQEIDSVLQIPDSILLDISTEGLIQTILNYPLFGDIYFIEDYQHSFDQLKKHFNGFRELFVRENAFSRLTERYYLMNPCCKINNWPSLNGTGTNSSFSFAFIEIILSQYAILSQPNLQDLKYLLKEVVNKYELKNQNNYSIFSKKHTLLIAGRILVLLNYAPFVKMYEENIQIKEFIDNMVLNNNFETLEIVYNYTKNYLQNS